MDEVELEAEEQEPSEVEAPERVAWYRRRAIARIGVGAVVLLVAGSLSVASLDESDADRLDTDEALEVDDDPGAPARPGRTSVPERDRPSGEGELDERPGSERTRRSSRRTTRRGSRSRSDRNGRGNRPDRPDRPADPGGPSTSAPPTTQGPPTTVAPGDVVVTPVGEPGPLAPVTITGQRPCPAGTSAVTVVVTASGGDLDGEVLLELTATPAADGTWSLPAVVVPAVSAVPEVAWAATAPSASVTARCGAGPAYGAASVALGTVDPAPIQSIAWQGATAVASVTGCPTAARLELHVGQVAPTLDRHTEPAQAVELVLDATGEVPTWRGSLDAAPAPAGQGRWVSVACLDGPDGDPVWRHPLVPAP